MQTLRYGPWVAPCWFGTWQRRAGAVCEDPFHSLPECKNWDALADSSDRSQLGLIPFHPLVRPPHVPAMDAGAERCEFSRPRRVGAEDVLRVLLPERSGGYRFLEAMASPDRFSQRLNQ